MMRYSIEPPDRILLKGYDFLSFAKNVSRNIGKSRSKNLSNEYSHKLLNHAKKSATDALKTVSKRAIQRKADTTGDMIGHTVTNKTTQI